MSDTEPQEPTERDERQWIAGNKAAFARVAMMCAGELDGADRQYMALLAERNATVVKLRAACDEAGDNNWPDNLYLPDIIEKHLMRHIETEITLDESASEGDQILLDIVASSEIRDIKPELFDAVISRAIERLVSIGLWET